MALIDTHCHLDFEAFDSDRQEVLQRAEAAGVEAILNPSIDLANSAKVMQLAESNETVFAAIGVHPNSSQTWQETSTAELRNLAKHSKVVAVGEIGLDYYRDKAPRAMQQQVFQRQLDLAAELELPVIVHNRQAGEDVLRMLLDWQAELVRSGSPLADRPGVLHSFSENAAFAQKAIAQNFLIGFTGPITFRNAPELQQTAEALPLDHLLVETDSPFLAPHPHRGQRNEPAMVKLVAGKLAELRELSIDEVTTATTASARRLFRFGVGQ